MKKVLFGLIVITALFVITGCGISEEEKQKRKRYIEQAETNAINYIEDKYGFTPEKVSAECRFDNMPFSNSCLDELFVSFSYNNKSGIVLISGKNESNKGLDNYQYEEIVDDILHVFEEKIGAKPYKYIVEVGSNGKNLLEEYYIKGNLEKFLSKKNCKILLEYIDMKDFDNKINKENFDIFKNLTLINYSSIENYKAATSHNLNANDHIKENIIYIDGAFDKTFEKVNYYKFNVEKLDDMYFVLNENEKIDINRSSIDDIDNWNGRGASSGAKQISSAYSINTNADSVVVYIPINQYKKYSAKQLSIAIQCQGKDFTTKYFTSGPFTYARIGDYYVESLPLVSCQEDIKFAIIKD